MMPRGVWGEAGVTVVPVLVVVLVVSAIGIGLVGVMNTDITHATIQGAVSRSYFVTQAGLEDAVVQLKANALFRTAPYPAVVGAQNFGGGQFWLWVEDYAEDMVQITSRGRATTAGRTVTAEVRAIVLNRTAPADDPSVPHNAGEIARLTGIAPSATLPFVSDIEERARVLGSTLAGKIQF